MMDIKKSVEFIKEKISFEPEVGIILGSGLGDFANNIENSIVINTWFSTINCCRSFRTINFWRFRR